MTVLQRIAAAGAIVALAAACQPETTKRTAPEPAESVQQSAELAAADPQMTGPTTDDSCGGYAGTYVGDIPEWDRHGESTITITCTDGVPRASTNIPGPHTMDGTRIEIDGNEVDLVITVDAGRRINVNLSGPPERLTGWSKFKYSRGSGYGGGRTTLVRQG